jgi:Tfp pilus assembly protein PilF
MVSKAVSEAREPNSFLDRLRFFDKSYVVLLFVLIAAIFAYSNTFDTPFHFDDVFNITQNPLITDLSNIPTILAGSKGPFASRPLMHVTFNLNYYFGGLDTRGFHAMNLAIHLINGILIYMLVVTTGSMLGYAHKQVRLAAVLSSLLFLLHPVQTEAVTYVVSRSMLFATTFFLLGLILYAKAVTSDRRRGLYIAGLFMASLMGMGSRENFAMFVPMVFIYDVFFISRFNLRETLKHYRAYIPVIVSFGCLAFIVLKNTYDTAAEFQGVAHNDYFLTQFKVHWTYIRLLILPVSQNIDYDYPVSSSLLEFSTLIAFIGYLVLWVLSIVFARKRPVAAFSVLWFLVTLLPISFVVTFMDLKLDDVIFEHRLYLPGAGLLMMAGALLVFLLGKLGEKKRYIAFTILVLVLVPALSTAAYRRNAVWENEYTLWGDAAAKSPRKARPHNNLGYAYLSEERMFEAIEHFNKALSIDHDYAEAHYNIGLAYADKGLIYKAMEHYQSAVRLKPDMFEAQINLGNAYMEMDRPELAAERYKAAIRQMPRFSKVHLNLGNAYVAMGLYDKAIEHFRIAIDITPYRAEWHNNLANAYYLNGQVEEANKHFKKAMGLDRTGH